MRGLTFEYPDWFIIFCVLAGLLYAAILYYRDGTFREQAAWLKWLLAGLRFAAVTTLALLLLSPLLRYLQTESQDPVIVVAQDVSESVAAGLRADTTAYRERLSAMIGELEEDYEVRTYTFGDEVRESDEFSFRDKKTNLSALLQQVYDLYGNQNLGAVVLATDGIYNAGSNPAYASIQLGAPVYTVALGDTTRQRDLVLRRVFHNRIAYLNDKFSIQIDVAAQNAAGANSRLTVSRVGEGGTQQLASEAISVDRDNFFTTREFILDADRGGVQRYRISLSPAAGEENTANNYRDIFVDVLDARQKILLLAHAPHPDLTAIRQALAGGRNNELEVAYAATFQGNVADYDMVILHQLPSRQHNVAAVLTTIENRNIPAWYIAGEATFFPRFNALQSLLRIASNGQNTNEVQARVANDFSLFNISDELRSFVPAFPPLLAPFGEFSTGPGASVLLYQRIGRVDTRYPLLALGEQDGSRIGVLAATGLWQWRLFDYLEHGNHERFNELVSQVVQYLSVKEDKRRFRVSLPENIFDENEPVTLDAELYNDNYELINEPDVTTTITDEEGRDYDFTFNRTGRSYTLRAGVLPVGNYRYRATTNTGTETLTAEGRFSVQPVQVELYETTADHGLLRLLSDRYGGEFLTAAEMNTLPGRISARDTVKPVIYESTTTRSVINLKWIFFILLALLSLEWFLRRYFGAY